MDIGAIRFELKQLLGMEVDVLTPNSLPASFRDQVLREAMARTRYRGRVILCGRVQGPLGARQWAPGF